MSSKDDTQVPSGTDPGEESGPEAGVRRYRARRDRGIDRLLRELHAEEVAPPETEEHK